MKATEFCYWLQGFFELTHGAPTASFDTAQVDCIKRHLALVFAHDIDPKAGDAKKQETLNTIHSGYKPHLSELLIRC